MPLRYKSVRKPTNQTKRNWNWSNQRNCDRTLSLCPNSCTNQFSGIDRGPFLRERKEKSNFLVGNRMSGLVMCVKFLFCFWMMDVITNIDVWLINRSGKQIQTEEFFLNRGWVAGCQKGSVRVSLYPVSSPQSSWFPIMRHSGPHSNESCRGVSVR